MVKTAIIIVKKEIWELKRFNKRMLTSFAFLIPVFMFMFTNGNMSLVPVSTALPILPLLIVFCTSIIFSGNALASEKNSMMLDIMLSQGIRQTSILLGKTTLNVILSFLFGCLVSAILNIGFMYMHGINAQQNLMYYLLLLFVAGICSNIAFGISVLLKDANIEQVATMAVNAACIAAPIVLLNLIGVDSFGNGYWALLIYYILLYIVSFFIARKTLSTAFGNNN